MRLYNVNSKPEGKSYGCELSRLDKDEEARLITFAAVWYWYAVGYYEGAGQLIAQREDGKWMHTNLHHCSCYGPLGDGAIDGQVYDSLCAMKKAMSEDLRAECENLFAAIKETESC